MIRANSGILMYCILWTSGQSIQKNLMNHDENLMLTELQSPLVKIPSINSMSSTICPRHKTRRLPDDICLLLKEGDIVTQRYHLLVHVDLVPRVLDQHDSYEGFPTSCSQINNNIPSFCLLQQINLEKDTRFLGERK